MNLVTKFKNIINSELEKRGLELELDYSDTNEDYYEYYLECSDCEDIYFNAGIFEFIVEGENGRTQVFRFKFAKDDEHDFYKLRIGDVIEYRFSEALFDDDGDPQEWHVIIENGELFFTATTDDGFFDEKSIEEKEIGEKQFKVIDFKYYPMEDADDEVETQCTESTRYKLNVNFADVKKFHYVYDSYEDAHEAMEKEIKNRCKVVYTSEDSVVIYTVFSEPIYIKIEKINDSKKEF